MKKAILSLSGGLDSTALLLHLIDKGYDEKYGARPLRRAVERYLEDPLAEAILRGDLKKNELIKVVVADDLLDFTQDQPASSVS